MSADYSGSSFHATTVSTAITIPASAPRSSADTYMELLSVFDDANNYYQFGLLSEKNNSVPVWGFSATQWSYCGTSSIIGQDATWFALIPDSTNTFTMTLGGGILNFLINGGSVYSVSDTATNFLIQSAFCGGPDFTDYQEVHTLAVGRLPAVGFHFHQHYSGYHVNHQLGEWE